MVVALVERPAPEAPRAATPSAPAAEQPAAEQTPEQASGAPPSAPTSFAVQVGPTDSAPSRELDVLSAPNSTAIMQALPDSVRAAIEGALRCRVGAQVEGQQAGCPPSSERSYAQADAAGLGPRAFLDTAGLAPYEGFNVVEVGPVAMVFTMEGPGAMPYRVVIRPRGAALTSADRQAGHLVIQD
jgi:hypothetical protein